MTFEGHLELEACRQPDGSTQVGRQSFCAPFHISKPYWDGSVLELQIVNPTAGILEGDRLRLDLSVASGASLRVGTPSATRAFMMRAGAGGCTQQLRVASGAWLEFSPEPLYPHAGTRYAQETRLQLARDSSSYYLDMLAPGRAARGELWAWESLELGLSVELEGRIILRERQETRGEEMRALAAFHGFEEAWFATLVVQDSALPQQADWWAPLQALQAKGLWVGCTRPLPGLAVLRVVAAGSVRLRETLARVRAHFATVLPGLRTDFRKL